jgi:hypothetical protein
MVPQHLAQKGGEVAMVVLDPGRIKANAEEG